MALAVGAGVELDGLAGSEGGLDDRGRFFVAVANGEEIDPETFERGSNAARNERRSAQDGGSRKCSPPSLSVTTEIRRSASTIVGLSGVVPADSHGKGLERDGVVPEPSVVLEAKSA